MVRGTRLRRRRARDRGTHLAPALGIAPVLEPGARARAGSGPAIRPLPPDPSLGEPMVHRSRHGPSGRRFRDRRNPAGDSSRRQWSARRRALYRSKAVRYRLEARKARTDMRQWVVERRARTRLLIELGGLVVKAGLVDLTDDDRAVIFGIMVDAAASLRSERGEQAQALWRRRGKRAFDQAADLNGAPRQLSASD